MECKTDPGWGLPLAEVVLMDVREEGLHPGLMVLEEDMDHPEDEVSHHKGGIQMAHRVQVLQALQVQETLGEAHRHRDTTTISTLKMLLNDAMSRHTTHVVFLHQDKINCL
jgi:hypothetical protein